MGGVRDGEEARGMCDRRSAVSLLVASVVALGLLGGCGST